MKTTWTYRRVVHGSNSHLQPALHRFLLTLVVRLGAAIPETTTRTGLPRRMNLKTSSTSNITQPPSLRSRSSSSTTITTDASPLPAHSTPHHQSYSPNAKRRRHPKQPSRPSSQRVQAADARPTQGVSIRRLSSSSSHAAPSRPHHHQVRSTIILLRCRHRRRPRPERVSTPSSRARPRHRHRSDSLLLPRRWLPFPCPSKTRRVATLSRARRGKAPWRPRFRPPRPQQHQQRHLGRQDAVIPPPWTPRWLWQRRQQRRRQ